MNTIATASTFGWSFFAATLLALAMWIAMCTGRVPSLRLSVTESQVDVPGPASRRLQNLRATPIPGRRGAWNALISIQDSNRLKAQLASTRTRKAIISFSFVTGACLLVAALLSTMQIYFEVGRAGHLPASTALRFSGLMIITLCAWYAVPTTAIWMMDTIQRARLPFAWRLLARSHAIATLSTPRHNRWVGHENPSNGTVSTATARRLLNVLEAELVATFAQPRSNASDGAVWRTFDARRVTRVLAATALLLDKSGGEVHVEEIYDWIDLLVDEIVNQKTHARRLASTEIAPELFDAGTLTRARRTLGMGFWRSPAGTFIPFMFLCVVMIAFGVVYPEIRSWMTPYPDITAAALAFITVAVTPFIAHLTGALFRSRQM